MRSEWNLPGTEPLHRVPWNWTRTGQGYSNSGHTGARFNGGIDWKAEPDKLGDLFEYLKTL
jgi:hypothetical protein